MLISILLGACALALSLVFTPRVRQLALNAGWVDSPDEHRKLHATSVPRVGGIAVFAAYAAAMVIAWLVSRILPNRGWCELPGGWYLASAVAIVFVTGLCDDLKGLTPKQKLLGQVVAALVAWLGGVQIHVLDGLAFGSMLSLPLTILWLVLCANAFNLIDGLDGLATGASLVATLTVLVAAIIGDNHGLLLVSIPLVGALLGFLRYNFNPASIFLGDCGSLTLGFLLACFATFWGQKTNTLLGVTAPLMAYALPLFDTGLSIARRALRYRPIFTADRGHIHHRLLDKGNSPKQAAVLLYGICILAAAFSLLEQTFHQQFGVWVVVAFSVVACLGIHQLGYLELRAFRRLLSSGVVFRQIDDQVRLTALEKALAEASSMEDALRLIIRACADLGFQGVALTPVRSEVLLAGASTKCQVTIPIGNERVLILDMMSKMSRRIALPQLSDIVIHYFESRPWPHQQVTQIKSGVQLLTEAMHG